VGRRVIARIVGCIVDFARRNAAAIATLGLLVSLAAGFYAATHLAVDTDLDDLDEAVRRIALAENSAVFNGFWVDSTSMRKSRSWAVAYPIPNISSARVSP